MNEHRASTPNERIAPEIFTIGHVAMPIDQFIGLLKRFGIGLLVDIRRFPGSRKSPQFGSETLRESLEQAGIGYVHLEALGGRRQPRLDSQNCAWRNASFRGYADYMETEAFETALRELMDLASNQRVAIMCSEAVWWRCHRSMVSDALMARGWQVWHIMSDGSRRPHHYTEPARLENGVLTYHQLLPCDEPVDD